MGPILRGSVAQVEAAYLVLLIGAFVAIAGASAYALLRLLSQR